jgi:hypothetical protein
MNFDLSHWLLILPGILIGLTVHEYSHARAADHLGDYTSAYAGRLTLNPLAHIDLMGFLMLLLAGFGWANRGGNGFPGRTGRQRGYGVYRGLDLISQFSAGNPGEQLSRSDAAWCGSDKHGFSHI